MRHETKAPIKAVAKTSDGQLCVLSEHDNPSPLMGLNVLQEPAGALSASRHERRLAVERKTLDSIRDAEIAARDVWWCRLLIRSKEHLNLAATLLGWLLHIGRRPAHSCCPGASKINSAALFGLCSIVSGSRVAARRTAQLDGLYGHPSQ